MNLKYMKCFVGLLCMYWLCGCTGVNFSDWHFPYMMEVQQGNYITEAEFNQIKLGMSKEQVVFVLNYPLSQFLFTKNRWDFYYQYHKNNDLKKKYQITLFFDKNGYVDGINKSVDRLFTD